MNDEQLKVIYDLQDLLGISYQEAYKIVDEYIYYGDVDLSDFEDDTTINTLTPIHKNIILNIMNNVQTVPLLHIYDKEILLNMMNNQESVSHLKARDKEVLLNIIQNNTISKLLPKEHELLVQIRNNKQDINTLSTKEKQVELSVLNNNTKIDLLTTKSSVIDLDVSKSDSSTIKLLDRNDKELSIDIELGLPTTPSHVDLDNINPLSISSISSIHDIQDSVNVIYPLELNELPNIHDFNVNTIDKLSLGKLPNIHEFNVNEIDSLSINKLSNITEIDVSTINELNINNLPNVSMKHKLLKYIPYLAIGNLPNITPFDIESINTLQLSKLDNFKWGRINARVNKNDLPLLSLNSISDVNKIELSELDELVLFDVPELPNFDIEEIKVIEYDSLHLDDNLDILNEIIKSDILPPITKEYIISKGGDADTVNDLYDTYRENSSSYSKSSIDVFFQYALAAVDEAIANGGKEKGLYKIVTEERGTFLPFITELYMTELCQYDYNPGLVIQEYLKVIKSFLVVEAEKYNLEVI